MQFMSLVFPYNSPTQHSYHSLLSLSVRPCNIIFVKTRIQRFSRKCLFVYLSARHLFSSVEAAQRCILFSFIVSPILRPGLGTTYHTFHSPQVQHKNYAEWNNKVEKSRGDSEV